MKASCNIKIDTDNLQWAKDNRFNISEAANNAILDARKKPAKELGPQAKLEYERAIKILENALYRDDMNERDTTSEYPPTHIAETWARMLRPYGYKHSGQELLDIARTSLDNKLSKRNINITKPV